MDISTIAKNYTHLQRQSLTNLVNTLFLLHDSVEKMSRYWAYQLGMSDSVKAASDQYRNALTQGRTDAVRLINLSSHNVEKYFSDR
jgi:hypothetical protein